MKDKKQPKIIIFGLGEYEYDEFMELFYNLIISHPEDILNHSETPKSKIEKLNHLLKFFEESEQYEKCAEIKKLQELINSSNE
jgi:CRISPR/Cas system CMR-associated protein Cmr3 (group 5 of RAMP superfamily)